MTDGMIDDARALLDRIGIHPSIEGRVIAIILHRDAGTLHEITRLVDNQNGNHP